MCCCDSCYFKLSVLGWIESCCCIQEAGQHHTILLFLKACNQGFDKQLALNTKVCVFFFLTDCRKKKDNLMDLINSGFCSFNSSFNYWQALINILTSFFCNLPKGYKRQCYSKLIKSICISEICWEPKTTVRPHVTWHWIICLGASDCWQQNQKVCFQSPSAVSLHFWIEPVGVQPLAVTITALAA